MKGTIALVLLVSIVLLSSIVAAQEDPKACEQSINAELNGRSDAILDYCSLTDDALGKNAAKTAIVDAVDIATTRECWSNRGPRITNALNSLCSSIDSKCLCKITVDGKVYSLWPGEYLEVTLVYLKSDLIDQVKISCGTGKEGYPVEGKFNRTTQGFDVSLLPGRDVDLDAVRLYPPGEESGYTTDNIKGPFSSPIQHPVKRGTPDKSGCYTPVELLASPGSSKGTVGYLVPGTSAPEFSVLTIALTMSIALLVAIMVRRK